MCNKIVENRFQSTRPMRGGTYADTVITSDDHIFQSTRPMRGGTGMSSSQIWTASYFNPPAPCGAGRRGSVYKNPWRYISIHPPHAGRDDHASTSSPSQSKFQSTRPMRGGTMIVPAREQGIEFQSTRPMRGGTYPESAPADWLEFQSTRPMRGGTRCWIITGWILVGFQSTRPMRGGTFKRRINGKITGYFNPPAPCGAGRPQGPGQKAKKEISIHPPHAGRDVLVVLMVIFIGDFNPPAPCGAGRCQKVRPIPAAHNFNPPAPCGAGLERAVFSQLLV